MRIGLIIEYDGTAFHGSQFQANARTVQGELEQAAQSLFGKHRRVALASRTDAGTHATGQVATLDADSPPECDTIRNALNYYLPEDVKVRSAAVVAARFDPRRHATHRTYEYTLNDSPAPPAIHRRTSVHVKTRLDARAMDAACGYLTGTQDFASFAGPATPPDAVTVRRVDLAKIERSGDIVKFTITANAFLHQQVRRLAGALVEAGKGKIAPESVQGILSNPVRGAAHYVMPAKGLCLTSIRYDGSEPGRLPTPAQ